MDNPYALAVDPSGHHLYVTGSNGGLAAYSLDSTTGALTPVSGSPYPLTCCESFGSAAVDPTGRFLYVQNYSTGTVYGFGIDQVSGALTALSGSPFTSGVNTSGVAVDASGRFVYVGSQANGGGMVALAINPTTGALTTVTGSPFAAPGGILAITTTAAGTGSTATLVSLALRPSPLTIRRRSSDRVRSWCWWAPTVTGPRGS